MAITRMWGRSMERASAQKTLDNIRKVTGRPRGLSHRLVSALDISLTDIGRAILGWPSEYQTREGTKVIGMRIGELNSALARQYRGATRLDASDYKSMGATIVEAMYVGGAHPTGKYIKVVVLPEGVK
jgi:hypothetical protein